MPRLFREGAGPEVAGALLIVFGVITLVAFATGGGRFTAPLVGGMGALFGWAAPLVPVLLAGLGTWLVLQGRGDGGSLRWLRPAGAGLLFVSGVGLLHLLASAAAPGDSLRRLASDGTGGGWLGYAIGASLAAGLGQVAAGALLIVGIAIGATVASGRTIRDVLVALRAALADLAVTSRRLAGRVRPPATVLPEDDAPLDDIVPVDVLEPVTARPTAATAVAPTPSREADGPVGTAPAQAARGRSWRLPTADEVLETASTPDLRSEDVEAVARTIESSLAEFGVPARVVKINRGPTVTQFGLEPGYVERAGQRSRVKVSRIVALHNDLALALSASPIRIQAPVPGRPYVGVEVPNTAAAIVRLRDVLQSDAFRQAALRGPLPVALGRDTSGRPVAAEVSSMPHLLVAGATGSGKSVAMNALICTLLMTHTPETLKLLLVDPKRVELVQYRGLPHLAAPVVVEIERVIGVLQWLVREMDRRYRLFADVGARHLAAYNRTMRERGQPVLPFLVIFIDELADLMMVAPDEAERLITRLAQLARATGIHLVLATQRPSVDVVTGLIKANFPSRIAFAVSSGVDSRVILDSVGAEKLLGRGDMLYQSSDSSRLQRLQGCFVADAEIERICRYWQDAAAAEAPMAETSLTLGLPEPLIQKELWEDMLSGDGDRARDRDPLFEDAVAVIREHRTASTSFLQRKLRVGYSRAARLLDQLEEAGLVGPAQGNLPREVRGASREEAALEAAVGDTADGGPVEGAPAASGSGDATTEGQGWADDSA